MKTKISVIIIAIVGISFIMAAWPPQSWKAPASADSKLNPLKDNAVATKEGKKLYDQTCVVCHGVKGKGDGVAVPGLTKVPADHSSATVQGQTDGALYWKIENGNPPMPSYKATYLPTQIWELVNYIRTLAAKK